MEAFQKFIKAYTNCQVQPVLINFRDFFQCEKIFLRFGVSFLKAAASRNPRTWEEIHFFVMNIATIVVVLLSMINFIVSILPNGSLIVAIEASAAIGVFSLMLLKTYTIMLKNRGMLIEILERIELHYPIAMRNQNAFQVGKYLNLLNIFVKTTIVVYSMVWLQNSCMVFFEIFSGWMTSSSVELELIIKFYVPFDYSNPMVYTLLYIFQSWILLVNIIAFLSVDLLYFGLMIVVSMEFDILSQIMSEIDPQEDQKAAVKKMKELVEIHQELIEITEIIEDIFSFILFANIFGMIYLICGTAFLSVSGISQYLLIKYFLTFITSSWNGFIQCYFGERLIRSSLSVSEGAYSCNWYDGSKEFKQLVCTVIVRSQKHQRIVAFKYVEVSLKTYQWIVDKAYSYYSVLTAIYNV
ncbi:hypothetical protein ACKWTF_013540 [Chironomus riparius]